MNRIIINNETDLDYLIVLEMISNEIRGERSASESICHPCSWSVDGDEYIVFHSLTKKGDSFRIVKV